MGTVPPSQQPCVYVCVREMEANHGDDSKKQRRKDFESPTLMQICQGFAKLLGITGLIVPCNITCANKNNFLNVLKSIWYITVYEVSYKHINLKLRSGYSHIRRVTSCGYF